MDSRRDSRPVPPGAQAVLVLLHNGFDTALTWDPVISLLDPGIFPIAYDRDGYGVRYDPAAEDDPLDIVEDGIRELDAVIRGIDAAGRPLFLWGHCVGGAIALAWAGRNPGAAAGVVAEAAGMFSDRELSRKSLWLMDEYRFLPDSYRAHFERMHGRAHADRVWDRIRNHRGSYIMNPGYSILPDLTGIDVPVLLVQGDSDVYFTAEHCRTGAAAIASVRVRVEIVPGGTHDLHTQLPETAAAMVNSFIGGLSVRR